MSRNTCSEQHHLLLPHPVLIDPRLSLGHCADGGSLAEEVFSTVRTAQAFGIQKVLADRYDMHINKAKASDMKAAIFQGCGMAVFFFVIYGGYGLGECCSCLPGHNFD